MKLTNLFMNLLVNTPSTVKKSLLPESNHNWCTQWNSIVELRKNVVAAVDTLGAQALANSNTTAAIEFRFQTLVGTMLSPQTTDQKTSAAFYSLKKLLQPNPFTAASVCKLSGTEIENAIKEVNFYKKKAQNLLLASQKCVSEYNGDIPSKAEELLAFKGVGPKIAYLTLTIAFGDTQGICVDTHVHRITNRLGWVNTWHYKGSNGPEKTRLQLEEFLPHELWADVNFMLVGFGQTICDAKSPKCDKCPLTATCKYYTDLTHMRE